jgi:hypothetical protein
MAIDKSTLFLDRPAQFALASLLHVLLEMVHEAVAALLAAALGHILGNLGPAFGAELTHEALEAGILFGGPAVRCAAGLAAVGALALAAGLTAVLSSFLVDLEEMVTPSVWCAGMQRERRACCGALRRGLANGSSGNSSRGGRSERGESFGREGLRLRAVWRERVGAVGHVRLVRRVASGVIGRSARINLRGPRFWTRRLGASAVRSGVVGVRAENYVYACISCRCARQRPSSIFPHGCSLRMYAQKLAITLWFCEPYAIANLSGSCMMYLAIGWFHSGHFRFCGSCGLFFASISAMLPVRLLTRAPLSS